MLIRGTIQVGDKMLYWPVLSSVHYIWDTNQILTVWSISYVLAYSTDMNRTIHIEIVCQKIMDCTIYVIITYSLWQEAYSPGEHGRGSGGERAISSGNKKQKYVITSQGSRRKHNCEREYSRSAGWEGVVRVVQVIAVQRLPCTLQSFGLVV